MNIPEIPSRYRRFKTSNDEDDDDEESTLIPSPLPAFLKDPA
jgi:hypothetical protein